MEESISLWETIVNYAIFAKASMILFLNKVDILEEKIHTSNLAQYFSEFKGLLTSLSVLFLTLSAPAPGSKQTLPEAALDFFTHIFEECVAPDEQGKPREIYTHPTTATDTGNIKRVLESVRDTILNNNLRAYAVL
jgi:hypothetical protein